MKNYQNKQDELEKKHFGTHNKTKKRLRTIGFITLPVGGILSLIGFIDFFSAFGGNGSPTLFFLLFLGFPLVGVGIACLKMGYMREVGTYVASQAAPVVKNVANYMMEGTRDEFSKTVGSVVNSIKEQQIICPKCKTSQDDDAKFCDNCGNALARTCRYCNEENDGDATFCKGCGKRLS
jgi:hypothetical protein